MPRFVKPISRTPGLDPGTSPALSRRGFNRGVMVLPFAFAGCVTEDDARPAPDRPWHHTASGFRNPPGSPARGGEFADWTSFYLRRFGDAANPELPAGHVLPADVVAAGLHRQRAADSVTWLGHASFLIRLDGRTILTDPFLTQYASPVPPFGPERFAPPPLAPAQLPKIDLLLLSHNHYDHLDLPTIEALPARQRIQVIVPLRLGHYFTSRGFGGVHELDWHGAVQAAGISVTALPAIHRSKRALFDRNETLWSGYAVHSNSKRLYFAGDTGYGPVFKALGRNARAFDLALLPIGAYEPRLLMKAVHVNPEEAVQVARELNATRIVAMHWGTIQLADEPAFEPPERFRAAARAAGYADDNAWVMQIGETRAI